MAKGCGCAGTTCGCKIVPGPSGAVIITGTGTQVDPYVVDVQTSFQLTSPNGTIYNVVVSDSGVLSTTPA